MYATATSHYGTALAGKFVGDVDVTQTISVDGLSMDTGAADATLHIGRNRECDLQAPAAGTIGDSLVVEGSA